MDMHGNLKASLLRTVLIAGVVLLGAGVAQATTPWNNPSGSNAAFGWSNGTNNTDLFGSPIVTTAGFFFLQPNDFSAQGGDGISDSATDFARVIVDVAGSTPAGAPPIHFITVEEWGTWSLNGSMPSDYSVQADYSVFRFSPAPPGVTGSLSLPVVFNADGTWTAARTLTAGTPGNPPFSDLDWNRFQITVTNTIQVNGTAPAGSVIEKAGMRIIIPEPASVMLVLGGLLPLLRRRC